MTRRRTTFATTGVLSRRTARRWTRRSKACRPLRARQPVDAKELTVVVAGGPEGIVDRSHAGRRREVPVARFVTIAVDEDHRSPARGAGTAAKPAVVASAKPPAPAPKSSKLDKPFIQIGIFSVQQNAKDTATAMRQAGMVPTIKTFTSNGKTFWRVVVGPALSADERGTLLAKIKKTGFTDAYAVTD